MKKIVSLLSLLSLILAACASATPTPPPTAAVEAETPYPAPTTAPQATESAYPEATQETAGEIGDPYPADVDQNGTGFVPDANTEDIDIAEAADFAATKADSELTRGPAFVEPDGSGIALYREGEFKSVLYLNGSVPNPCYQLRVDIPQADAKNRVMIEVYSVADPEKVCVDMLQPFSVGLILDEVASFGFQSGLNSKAVEVFVNEQAISIIEGQ